MCYKGWLQQCTQRSIGESSTSSISSRFGYYLIFILISLIFYYFNVLLFSLLNFPILLQTFTAKRFWIHQFLWLSDSPEFSWVILSLSLCFFPSIFVSLFLSHREPLFHLFSGGVVIVYERKVKLLYGTLSILILLNFKSQSHYFDFWRNCYI